MNIFSKILSQLNPANECRKFRVSLWQCPVFLFIIMGFVVMAAILISYYAAQRFGFEPEIQALIALSTAAITFIIGHLTIKSFSNLADISMMKSQFLNIISHQLLTPLSSLKWSVNLLTTKNIATSEKEKDDLLNIIAQSSENMINTVNSLLDISRLDVGKISLYREEVNILDIVKEVISGREADAKTKGNKLSLEFDATLPDVYTDKARIRVVINNLIDNAIKFSKPNTEIIIRLFKEGSSIMFSIEDFGVGISEEQRKHIYGKFFRADSPVRYQTKGFGLGLFAAKFIVNALGGDINFKSEAGVGSRFWFSLPIYKS